MMTDHHACLMPYLLVCHLISFYYSTDLYLEHSYELMHHSTWPLTVATIDGIKSICFSMYWQWYHSSSMIDAWYKILFVTIAAQQCNGVVELNASWLKLLHTCTGISSLTLFIHDAVNHWLTLGTLIQNSKRVMCRSIMCVCVYVKGDRKPKSDTETYPGVLCCVLL